MSTFFKDTYDKVKEISSIENQVQKRLSKMEVCHICGEKAVCSKYFKKKNEIFGEFLGVCKKHKSI